MKYYSITTNEACVPAATSITGTVSAPAGVRVVTGSGTLFASEIKANDALFDDVNNEIRIVDWVKNNTELWLRTGFSNALSGATVTRSAGSASEISVRASGDVTIIDSNGNSTTLLDGDAFNPKPEKNQSVQPFICDPAANTAYIEIVGVG